MEPHQALASPAWQRDDAVELEEAIDSEQRRGRCVVSAEGRHARGKAPQLLGGDSASAPPGGNGQNRPSGIFARCCTAQVSRELDFVESPPEIEEVIDLGFVPCCAPSYLEGSNGRAARTDMSDAIMSRSSPQNAKAADCGHPPDKEEATNAGVRWDRLRPILMAIIIVITTAISAFIDSWTERRPSEPSWGSTLNYGSVPIVAAVIGYVTNVAAIWMMFYPLEFMGCFPQLRIGCGLDMPLFGWQGVIPMKAVEMATLSVDLMTQKLIKVEEIFSRLSPQRVSEEVSEMLPDIVSAVINEAGRRHCPKLWEHMPVRIIKQLEDRVAEESRPMMARFIDDLQKNIADVFDLKACVVEVMTADCRILNDTFLLCGAEEFEFIKVSGFYLGFFFGVLQMLAWVFCKLWWTLPLVGVFVGYATNVVALKVIFLPVEPRKVFGFTVQGLFLQRQREVSALYAKQCAERILAAEVLMRSLVTGPSSGKMFELVDKHVAACMEEQATFYKPMFLMSIGTETWIDFRGGVCTEFRKRLPALLTKIQGYAQETLQLEDTLRERLEGLPSAQFERLLHAVFEQDEIKLILVGAILGAIVGFLQAMVQTPDQLGLVPRAS